MKEVLFFSLILTFLSRLREWGDLQIQLFGYFARFEKIGGLGCCFFENYNQIPSSQVTVKK